MALLLRSLHLTQPTTTADGTAEFVVDGTGASANFGQGLTAPLTVTIPGVVTGQQVNYVLGPNGYSCSFAGLLPGDYEATFTDSAAPTPASLVVPFRVNARPVLGCTDPAAANYNPNATQDNGTCEYAPPVRHPAFRVPLAQSLRFVQPGSAFDNRLLADETPLDVFNPGYCQLVERGDTLVLQVLSNYATAPTFTVRPLAGGAAVLTVPAVRVVQGAGQTAAFAAYLRPEPGNTARSRVYFNANTLPLPFAPADRVTIGGAGAVNGTYPVLAVLEDPAAAVPYLVLGVAYPSAAQRVDCTLQSAYAVQAFDTYQAVLPFAAVPAGFYRVAVGVSDPTFGAAEVVSEPVEVAAAHADTVLIEYRNFDNAFGLNYTAGLVNRQRVRGRFFQRETATTREVLRESTGQLLLLSAAAYRKVRLDVYLLPDYLHETLSVACGHDFLRVNALDVLAEEAYTATPVPHYALSNGTVLLEQTDFLGAGNRDDVGDASTPTTGTLLLVNDKFLKVNF